MISETPMFFNQDCKCQFDQKALCVSLKNVNMPRLILADIAPQPLPLHPLQSSMQLS